MARKPRPEPHTQGVLAIIYKHFFGALIKYKPGNYATDYTTDPRMRGAAESASAMTLKEWMEALFHLKDRDITRYISGKNFKMPGLYYQTANVKVQGIGYRTVNAGDEVYVRTDATIPDSVDVEVLGSRQNVFCLTRLEWNRIAPNLVEAERQRRARR